uniref:Uncharacterized protein n=1 Tax=Mycena chlorophos TaxID=658473 RepID=A0ABQ0LAI9_MYCCL|nr:predicted protein [Mycena chlorophos]
MGLPVPLPSDADVIPCTGIDLGPRRMVVTTGLLIDAKLDLKRLETTLTLLIEQKFPRAGARLALRNGIWEFHVPHKFDETTPAVVFTSAEYDELYASPTRPHIEHIRRSTESAPFVCELPNLDAYMRSPTCPSTTEAFLAPNTPLLRIHATTFNDLTFLGVTSTHILLDAVGTSELLRAWTRLLKGEPIESIPGMARDAEPFRPLTVSASKGAKLPHIRGWFKLGFFGTIIFLIQFLWRLWREPKEEAKLVRVPKAFLEKKKAEVMEWLAATGSEEWVGSSDVMLAWWYQISYSHRTDETPLHIHVPINLREMPIFSSPDSNSLTELRTPYINNAVASVAVPPIPISSLGTDPLWGIALHIRRAINAYRDDPAGVAADVSWRCSNPLKALFPCPTGAEYAIQTSWRVAKFAELDWSGAVPGAALQPIPQTPVVKAKPHPRPETPQPRPDTPQAASRPQTPQPPLGPGAKPKKSKMGTKNPTVSVIETAHIVSPSTTPNTSAYASPTSTVHGPIHHPSATAYPPAPIPTPPPAPPKPPISHIKLLINPNSKQPRVVALIPQMTSNKQRPLRGSGAVLMEDDEAIWMSQVSSVSDWEAMRSGAGVRFLQVEKMYSK